MRLKLTLLFLFISLSSTAQRKHSFALGVDVAKYSYHKNWDRETMNIFNPIPTYRRTALFRTLLFPFAQYCYKNKIGVRLHKSYIYQVASYKDPAMTPANFPTEQQGDFVDLVVGYNLMYLLEKRLSVKQLKNFSVWLYAGASYTHGFTLVSYATYFPISHHTYRFDYKHYTNIVRPTAHFQIKYNPIRYIMMGIGGTYHHVGKDFKPVSGNISLGLQI